MTLVRRRPVFGLAVLAGAAFGCGLTPGASFATTPSEACSALAPFEIASDAIGLPTRGATIASATLVASDAAGNADGEFCKALGAIHPVDATAPDIHFEVNLPSDWNGKALQFGGGGYNGNLITGLDNVRFFKPGAPTPLKRGYVTFGSDSGHQSPSVADGSFAMNAEALVNFGGAQLKKTHDVALALIAKRYGAKPQRTYFFGNSQGGHEGFLVVQRWPQDYDGVVAIHPVYDFTPLQIDGNALSRELYNPEGGWLNPAKLKMLQDAVMKTCDGLDGAEDGVISNVAACQSTFQLSSLRCADGKDAGDNCLSDPQINAVEAIHSRVSFGFALQSGVSSFAPWPILEGADWTGLFAFGSRPKPSNPPTPMKDFGLAVLSDPAVRFMATRNVNVDPLQFDPMKYKDRLQEASRLIDASDDDISAFKARGGKLLLMHGTVDSAVPPQNTIDYYQRLVARFGQGPLDDFVRFYIAPGFGHGTGQFVVGWDAFGALEQWVEKGEAPGPQIVVDTREGHRQRTRPLCVYPGWPRYVGGDIDVAASFTCVSP
ncbi:tannase/feruloyl esterase family alpha/beta hydrolase [Methylocapsa sp. S129]|uniref:tannase/feruloyl esterase family alpha/beta hydrolase n=1 Tax=Methylocapsa sp. S129 TaxID=1641869 RepID=UPI00131B74BA|nr:tannase/feruloyl esterase family alpha/beta hydrolase [Methylocapsa sp. S129]